MLTIKCKNCLNTENYGATDFGAKISNLQFFLSKEEDNKKWLCDKCENEYISKIEEQEIKIKKLKTQLLDYQKEQQLASPQAQENQTEDFIKS